MDNKFVARVKTNQGSFDVSWEDKKFSCENAELLDWIREQCDIISKTGQGVDLDGSCVAGCYGWSPELSYIPAFAALQTLFGGRVEMIEGHRPTWEEDLGWEPVDGAVT